MYFCDPVYVILVIHNVQNSCIIPNILKFNLKNHLTKKQSISVTISCGEGTHKQFCKEVSSEEYELCMQLIASGF